MSIRDSDSGFSLPLVAEKLRQNAGVSLVSPDGRKIGYQSEVFLMCSALPIYKLFDRLKGIPGLDRKYKTINVVNRWLTGKEPKLLNIEWKRSDGLTFGELAKLNRLIRTEVNDLFASDNIEKPNFIKRESDLQNFGRNARAKLTFIKQQIDSLALDPDSEPRSVDDLNKWVANADQLLGEDLGIAVGELDQKWIDKWEHIVGADQNITSVKGRAERSLRAMQIYKALVSGIADLLARDIENDTMTIASSKNYLELIKLFRKNNIDFSKIKSSVSEIAGRKDIGKSDLLELVTQLGSITKFIRSYFKHADSAYLLGQGLVHERLNCAGKELMFGMILDDLGLSPEYTKVEMLASGRIPEHVVTHVSLGEYVIEFDLNFRARDNQQEDMCGCMVNIMQKDGLVSKDTDIRVIESASGTQYKRISKESFAVLKLIWGSDPHKITTGSTGLPMNLMDFRNFAALLDDPKFRKYFSESECKYIEREARNLFAEQKRLMPLTDYAGSSE